MKKLFLYLGFSLFVLNLIAQDQVRIDSLLVKLKNEKADTLKANILNEISLEYLICNDHVRCAEFANKALQLAQKTNHINEEVGAYINLVYSCSLDWNKAKFYYEKAIELCIKANNKNLQAIVNVKAAEFLFNMNQFKPEIYAKRALEIYIDLNDSINIAKTYIYLSQIYAYWNKSLSKGDPETALKYVDKSFELSKKLKNLEGLMKCYDGYIQIYKHYYKDTAKTREYLNIATKEINQAINQNPQNVEYKILQHFIYFQWSMFYLEGKNDFKNAEANLIQAISMALKTKGITLKNATNNMRLGHYYRRLGQLYLENNLLIKSEECFNKYLQGYDQRNVSKYCYALLEIAWFYRNKGMLSVSYDYIDRSIKLAEKSDIGMIKWQNFYYLADLHQLMEDYQIGLKYYFKCYKIADGVKNYTGIIVPLTKISKLFAEIGQLDSSLYYNQKAEKLNETFLKDSVLYIWILNNYANIFEKQNDYKKAIEIHSKVLEIRNIYHWDQTIETPYGYVATNSSLARIYFELKEYDKALEYAGKSLKSFQFVQYPEILIDDYLILSKIYEVKNKPSQALDYYKKYITERDKIMTNQNQNKIQLMKIEKINNQKKIEIDNLNAAKKLEETKLKQQKNLTYSVLAGFTLVLVFAVFNFRSYRQKTKANRLLKIRENEVIERNDKLQQLNEEVTVQKEELQTTLENLKITQAELIQSEKMASLGQLIAGIAHEINTPLGAINASVNTITDSTQQSIKLLPDLVKALSESELKLFIELVNRSAINNNSLSSKEEREIRRKISSQLEEKGIAEAEDFADILVDMGIYDEIENYLALFKTQTMQAAYHLSMQIKNSQNIKMAVDRASKVVFALKNYARYGSEQNMVAANIIDGLETVLILYQNQLKHGIILHKELEEVPQILCYPDELNQVWTNLIHNAIQAMDGKGELTILVSKNPTGFQNLSGLQVRITDTGKGVPPEIKDRVFDAFFTTKAAGEGSGLGLYIVKQIVDKHKGRIWFESEVGIGTSVFVELLINQ